MNVRGADWSYSENKILLAAIESGASLDSVLFDLQALGSNRPKKGTQLQAYKLALKKGIPIRSWWINPNNKPSKKIAAAAAAEPEQLPNPISPIEAVIAPQTVAVALSEEKPIEDQLAQFSDRERTILRAYYPRWGADAVLRHLLEEQFFRSIEDIEAEAQRIGITRN